MNIYLGERACIKQLRFLLTLTVLFYRFSVQSLRLLEPSAAMKEVGITEHKLRFTSSVTMETSIRYHSFVEKMQSQLQR